ncbi:MAG: hypothetical protein RIG63_01400 [Coleofasciculus chthonoplastes F3-SA18-01]|uniref:hypothetical protein n=1 Tax=Coleofasciculus chthonoplastes TaxID=64178 RepID=UPI0032F42B11
MPEYQWKLAIVERNLLYSNWINLMPEAQERMLEEAEELLRDLPLLDKQRLLTFLASLKDTEKHLHQKIQQIVSHHIQKNSQNIIGRTLLYSHAI